MSAFYKLLCSDQTFFFLYDEQMILTWKAEQAVEVFSNTIIFKKFSKRPIQYIYSIYLNILFFTGPTFGE